MGEREIIYQSLHCHHQNDSCIKMGIDGSHFNVLLIVTNKATRQCPQISTFLRGKESRGPSVCQAPNRRTDYSLLNGG